MSVESAVKEAERKLMSKPNVTGVGVGERDGLTVVKVFVTRKLPLSQLRRDEVVPGKIGGYPTDVEEIGVVSVESESL